MSRNSTTKSKIPSFKTEAEEADWFASPAGRRHAEATLRRAIKKGLIETDSRERDVKAEAKATREGRAVLYRKGLNVQKTDPKVLAELLENARASMTRPVSLRIPVSDLDAAKRIAEKKGVGYQTVLKDIIRAGLARA